MDVCKHIVLFGLSVYVYMSDVCVHLSWSRTVSGFPMWSETNASVHPGSWLPVSSVQFVPIRIDSQVGKNEPTSKKRREMKEEENHEKTESGKNEAYNVSIHKNRAWGRDRDSKNSAIII